jgi:hypothetical protein
MQDNASPMEVDAVHIAASVGNVPCLEVALEEGQRGDQPETLIAAVVAGHLPCVRILCSRGKAVVTEETLVAAAKHAQVVALSHAFSRACFHLCLVLLWIILTPASERVYA